MKSGLHTALVANIRDQSWVAGNVRRAEYAVHRKLSHMRRARDQNIHHYDHSI